MIFKTSIESTETQKCLSYSVSGWSRSAVVFTTYCLPAGETPRGTARSWLTRCFGLGFTLRSLSAIPCLAHSRCSANGCLIKLECKQLQGCKEAFFRHPGHSYPHLCTQRHTHTHTSAHPQIDTHKDRHVQTHKDKDIHEPRKTHKDRHT